MNSFQKGYWKAVCWKLTLCTIDLNQSLTDRLVKKKSCPNPVFYLSWAEDKMFYFQLHFFFKKYTKYKMEATHVYELYTFV